MGTAERKEREKEFRRTEIINAAEKVLFSKGFEKSTMDDIAKKAELGKGTLYLYFDKKEDIFAEICNRGMNILNDMFFEYVKNQKNGLEKVARIGEAFIKFYKEHQDYYQVFLYLDNKKLNPNVTNENVNLANMPKKDGMELFFSVIAEGQQDGSIRKDIDPVKTAFLLWAEASGVLQLMQNKGKMIYETCGVTEDDMIKTFFESTRHALKA